MLAAGTSLMVIVLLYVAYLLGGLEWAGFAQGTALILFWVALFYVMLRTGLNLKFRDASMTVPQLASSLMTMAFVMYYADRGRAALLIVFLVSFLFGVFRMRTRQLLFLAFTAIASVRADGAGALSQQAGDRRARRRDSAAGRPHRHAAMVRGNGRIRQPAAGRDDLHQSRAGRREERRRSGGPCQEHVPRQHESRDPHADERRDRHDDPAARFRSHAGATRVRRSDSRERRRPADHHQRHPRLLEDRRRQARARPAALRSAGLHRGRAGSGRAASAREGPASGLSARVGAAQGDRQRHHARAADSLQPAEQRHQVHRRRRRHRHGRVVTA